MSPLDVDKVARALASMCITMHNGDIVCVDELGSTQDEARRLAQAGAPHGAVVAAEAQSRGRGRQGRSWVAPRGSALLCSMVLRPRLDIASLPPVSLVVGLAAQRSVASRVGGAGVKWPNDVLVGGKKVCGVLVETGLRADSVDWLVAGVGINVTACPDDPALQGRVTSLALEGATGDALDRSLLLADLLGHTLTLLSAYERGGLGALLPELSAVDATRGRRVRGDGFTGVASGIASDGRLCVDTAEGTRMLGAGEIWFEDPPPAGA